MVDETESRNLVGSLPSSYNRAGGRVVNFKFNHMWFFLRFIIRLCLKPCCFFFFFPCFFVFVGPLTHLLLSTGLRHARFLPTKLDLFPSQRLRAAPISFDSNRMPYGRSRPPPRGKPYVCVVYAPPDNPLPHGQPTHTRHTTQPTTNPTPSSQPCSPASPSPPAWPPGAYRMYFRRVCLWVWRGAGKGGPPSAAKPYGGRERIGHTSPAVVHAPEPCHTACPLWP
jgi:hypothetical protein